MPLKNDAIAMFFHTFVSGEALLQVEDFFRELETIPYYREKIVGRMYIESGRISDSQIARELDVITDSLDQLAEFWAPRLILLGIDDVIISQLLYMYVYWPQISQ